MSQETQLVSMIKLFMHCSHLAFFCFLAVTNWNIKKLFDNTTLENAIDDKSPIENLPEKNIPLTPIDELDKDMFLHMKNNIWC